MSLDLTKLPRAAFSDVREFVRDNNKCGRNPTAEAIDAHIREMDDEEFLDAYLCWNGIIGWTNSILCVIDRAREAKS